MKKIVGPIYWNRYGIACKVSSPVVARRLNIGLVTVLAGGILGILIGSTL